MIIQLTLKQQEDLLAWYRPIAAAHFEEECEPPGYKIEILVGGPLGSEALAVCGSARLDLGEVEVTLSSPYQRA